MISAFKKLMGWGDTAGTPSPVDPFWYQIFNKSGDYYSTETALQVSATQACVRVIAESISTLPAHLYRVKTNGKGRERERKHYLQKVLKDSPNNWMTSVEFFDQMVTWLLLKGNALYRVIPGPRGAVGQLKPIDPDKVSKVELLEDGRKRFHFHGGGSLDSQDTLHVMGMSFDGLWGVSVLEYAANTIGIATGAEKMGRQLFENGMRPSGVLTHPGTLSQPAQDRLKAQVAARHAGDFHKPLFLEEGIKWEQMSVTPEDAQFLETRKFQVEEICRIFRVPLHLVQDLEHATFSNIEHQSIEFVTHTLRPWLVRIEKAIKRDLIYEDDLFVEFTTEALLRGDIETRYRAYSVGLQSKFLNRNEVRGFENLNPVKGGDEFENPSITVDKNPTEADPPQDIKKGQSAGGINNEPKDPAKAAAALLAAGIADAAAKRERYQLEKRRKHADDRIGFEGWANEWYMTQYTWLEEKCNPFNEALGVNVIGAVQEQTHGVVESLFKCEDVATWIDNRLEDLELKITEALMGCYDEIPSDS